MQRCESWPFAQLLWSYHRRVLSPNLLFHLRVHLTNNFTGWVLTADSDTVRKRFVHAVKVARVSARINGSLRCVSRARTC